MATHFKLKIQGTKIKEYTSKNIFETDVWVQIKRAIENADDIEIPSTVLIHKHKNGQKSALVVEIAYDTNQ